MEEPGISLELCFDTGASGACFKAVTVLLFLAVALFTAPARVATGAAFLSKTSLTLLAVTAFAAGFTLLFNVVLAGFTMVFVAVEGVFDAGLVDLVAVADFLAAVFGTDLPTALLFGTAAVFAAVLLTLLAALLLVADLVTVAFITVPIFLNELPDLFDLYPKTVARAVFRQAQPASGIAWVLPTHLAKRLSPLLELKSKTLKFIS